MRSVPRTVSAETRMSNPRPAPAERALVRILLPEDECWTSHAASKLTKAHPGHWYSALEFGDCSKHSGANCTWDVLSVDKIVNKTCHSDSFFGAVQKAAPQPFANCSKSARPNATDPCWVRGFYEAVLGPNAGKRIGWNVTGLPLDDLIAFWSAPFESDDPARGGCPPLLVPPKSTWGDLPTLQKGGAALELSPRQRRWSAFARDWARGLFGA